MKFSTSTDDLKFVLNILNKIKVLDNKFTKNIADPVLVQTDKTSSLVKFLIKQNNLNLSYVLRANIESDGEFLTSVTLINNIIGVLSNKDVSFEKDKNVVNIKTRSSESTILINSEIEELREDFEETREIEFTDSLKIDREILVDGIKSVNHAASKNTINPELSSVYIYKVNKTIYFVSTDKYRLAEKRIDLSNDVKDFNILISLANISNIIKIFESMDEREIEIKISDTFLYFSTESISLYVRALTGEFIDYRSLGIIPKSVDFKIKFSLSKKDLQNFFKKALLFVDDKDAFNLKNLTDETLDLCFENKINGSTIDSVSVNNLLNTNVSNLPSYNYRFIQDFLSNMNDERVEFSILEERLSVLKMEGEKEKSFVGIISPLIKN